MSGAVLLAFYFSCCGGGLVATLALPARRAPQVLAWSGSLASLFALVAGGQALLGAEGFQLPLWTLPELGQLVLSLDRLSGLFLLVGGLVALPVSVFAAGVVRARGQDGLRAFTALYLTLLASIALIPLAGDAFTLLIAWEAMSILSYLLVVLPPGREESVPAGFLMLGVGEVGTLAVALALLLLGSQAGGVDFAALKGAATGLGAGPRWTIFALSFFGFGVKAGLVPVNFWLPRAYTAAPAAFVPLLAGVTLNLGIYGILRVNGDLIPLTLVGPGLVALGVGAVTALVGILYATVENDLKTLLAHSSIENAGIITAGLGASFTFTAAGRPVLAAIALAAALYHLVNHSLYKALLFMGAGAVELGTGSRDLDRLGGLLKRMPWLGLFVLFGTLAIAGLPPLNGFVSEWLSLQTMLRSAELASIGVKIAFALAGAGLALTLALAVTCFVKAFAMGFLGLARSPAAERAGEAPRSVLIPLGFLASLCLLLGLGATYVVPALDGVVRPLAGASATEALVPPFFATHPEPVELPPALAADFHDLGAQVGETLLPGRGLVVLHRGGEPNPVVFATSPAYAFLVLLLLLAVTYAGVWVWTRRRGRARGPCWDGGVTRLLPEMTYTASGFANPVRVVFEATFRPTVTEDTQEAVASHFRSAIRRTRQEQHIVDRWVVHPLSRSALRLADLLAKMHHGKLNAYVVYLILTLLVALFLGLGS